MSNSLYLIACLWIWLLPVPPQAPGTATPGRGGGQPAAQGSEGDVFEAARRSVFLVETESGHGSGFLVDASGLILTNHHVIAGTLYLAVAVDPGHKYPAVVVVTDPLRDLAVIRVNPAAVAGLPPLRFTDDTAGVKVGERVLAIGSALTGDGSLLTTGIVSRVTADTVIADLNVNPGSSGGPLLSLSGQVIGICTFHLKAATGPGLAGIVRGHVALQAVASAAASLAQPPPPAEPLPVASPIPYPSDALLERAAALDSLSSYATTSRGMRIHVLTPPAVYFEAHEAEIRKLREHGVEAGQNNYAWQAQTGGVEAIVGIRVVPEHHRAGSVVRLRLFRNGVEVAPIVPGRFCGPTGRDPRQPRPQTCFALYQYEPHAFAPGFELELFVYPEGEGAKPRRWKLPAALVRRVWLDFSPWRISSTCPAPCRDHDPAAGPRTSPNSSEVRRTAPGACRRSCGAVSPTW